MHRIVGLTVLGLLAIPVDASNPSHTKKEKPRPTESAEPPLAPPIPIPPAAPEPLVSTELIEAVLCPHAVVAKLVVTRLIEDPNDPNVRMRRLLNESEDLRQAREELHKFWMNNQPSVLTYERVNGAARP
jgi:hypothetical protein